MLHPTDRLMIDDIIRVTAARLAAPSGAALLAGGKTSPAHLTFESYERCGGQFLTGEMLSRGGYKWLRAAAVLAHRGVDLDNDGPDCNRQWAKLLANRSADVGRRGKVTTRIADKTPPRRDIIKDIVRVAAAAGIVPPVRPSFPQYRELGGVHPIHHVAARGGWVALCAKAGFTAAHPSKPDLQTLRTLVVQDIARVAAALAAADPAAATSNGFAKSEYRAAGGRYPVLTINSVQGDEGWHGLCREAGVKPAGQHHARRAGLESAEPVSAKVNAPRRKAAVTQKEIDQALDEAVASIHRPNMVAWINGKGRGKWKARWRLIAKARPTDLDRDEVLADVRRAARSAGIPVGRMVLETYHACGGRFSAEDLREFGGFSAACRAASQAA
jgi:hypothetical protein